MRGVCSRAKIKAGSRAASGSRAGASRKKFATLGDLGSTQPQDERDDDSDDDQDLFAGGEKSGLAVQNPDDLKRKILEKARR
jgi:UBX domain-containing protein 1